MPRALNKKTFLVILLGAILGGCTDVNPTILGDLAPQPKSNSENINTRASFSVAAGHATNATYKASFTVQFMGGTSPTSTGSGLRARQSTMEVLRNVR